MQDLFGSVRRSLILRATNTTTDDINVGGFGATFADKIGSTIRKSRIGLFTKPLPSSSPPPPPPLPTPEPSASKENMPPDVPPIRWRKGELIGCGAFGRVYMGMNLDSGELLAVKQVLIAASGGATKEKTQAHIRELEEEVKLLKNLSHPNIVRYLGTAREDDALNILLEFVPGGSIASLLGKFGSFPESVIRMYTKQLLLGLEYLHKNGIMHRDIKGANILVDNKGCIKLADFGASKKVVELATMTGAKSMKGTPYWMAPEVIVQTGHSFSADIWSFGCTVIEMATGKPPWCQLQEVTALFHIGSTKSAPPIPEHLSEEAKDFLLKCLQKEPHLRASATELLQHPFVTGDYKESQPPLHRSLLQNLGNPNAAPATDNKSIRSNVTRTISVGLKDICNMGSVRCSTVYPDKFSRTSNLWGTCGSDDDLCMLDDKDDFGISEHQSPAKLVDDFNKSFNPMCEPNDDWPCKFDDSPEVGRSGNLCSGEDCGIAEASCNGETEFTFPSEPSMDDDEVTESKIRAFLDEKALDLKKLQDGFYNTLDLVSPKAVGVIEEGEALSKLPAKSKSPSGLPSRRLSTTPNIPKPVSPARHTKAVADSVSNGEQPVGELPELKELQKDGFCSRPSFSERQRRWKEELDKELELERERLRQAGAKISSPSKRTPNQQRERLPFTSPAK